MKIFLLSALLAFHVTAFSEQDVSGRELLEAVQKEFYSHKLDDFLANLEQKFATAEIAPSESHDQFDEPLSLRPSLVAPHSKKKHQDLIRKRNKKLLKAVESNLGDTISKEALTLASYFLTPDEEKALHSFKRLEIQAIDAIEAPSKKAVAMVLREYKLKKQWLDDQMQKEATEEHYKQKIALELAKLDAVEKTLHDFPISSLKRKFPQYHSAAMKNVIYEIDFAKLKNLTHAEAKNLAPLEKKVARVICDYLNETKKANLKLIEKIHYDTSNP